MTPRPPLAALVLLASACAAPEPAVDPAAVQAELAAAMADYGQSVLSGNIDAALDRLSADIHILEPGMNLKAQQAHDFFRNVLSTAKVHSFETRTVDYFIHGDVAYETGEYDETVEMQGQTNQVKGYYFIRWEKGEDGKWRFDRIVASPREAPQGM
jgi:ketosteroid isomerase-like protein